MLAAAKRVYGELAAAQMVSDSKAVIRDAKTALRVVYTRAMEGAPPKPAEVSPMRVPPMLEVLESVPEVVDMEIQLMVDEMKINTEVLHR